jgi:putative inorganic carbon (hco3(-)) transporter
VRVDSCSYPAPGTPLWETGTPHTPIVRTVFAPVQILISAPVALYLLTLAIFLFRPPTLPFHSVDRIAFVVLLAGVAVRQVIAPRRLRSYRLSVPMVGLCLLAGGHLLRQPFEVSTWSVLAAKFFVPFAMYWMAGLVFTDERSLRWLERFWLAVLGYLCLVAVAHLIGAYALVFPKFILDETIGTHAERARGPFLQAVANGVTINILGLLAIDGHRRGRLKGTAAFLVLGALPLAILATKTRGVWLSFAASVIWLTFKLNDRKMRSAALLLAGAGIATVIGVMVLGDGGRALDDRLEESSAVEFRLAAYRAGYEMFLERPLLGWGTKDLQDELAHRIDGFRGESFAVHNTYFDVLLEQGAIGLCFYLWLLFGMFRLGRAKTDSANPVLVSIRMLWVPLLVVYFVNATFVVMNYQFVNGLLFTFAGILSAHTGASNESEVWARAQ